MLVQSLISKGEVDYASWRKRKAAREQRERDKVKRPKRFDYVDPVDDPTRRVVPMANLHLMKFHETKVERDGFSQAEKEARRKAQQKQIEEIQSPHLRNGSIDSVVKTAREAALSNLQLDTIERRVTEIMQKYCTPSHPATARFQPGGRHSAVDRVSSSLSRIVDGTPSAHAGRNNLQNQTQQPFGVATGRAFNATDLSTKHSTQNDGARRKDLSTSIQVGSLSVRNNSIGEAIEHAHRDNATVGDDSPSDRLVIAPKSPIITR